MAFPERKKKLFNLSEKLLPTVPGIHLELPQNCFGYNG